MSQKKTVVVKITKTVKLDIDPEDFDLDVEDEEYDDDVLCDAVQENIVDKSSLKVYGETHTFDDSDVDVTMGEK